MTGEVRLKTKLYAHDIPISKYKERAKKYVPMIKVRLNAGMKKVKVCNIEGLQETKE